MKQQAAESRESSAIDSVDGGEDLPDADLNVRGRRTMVIAVAGIALALSALAGLNPLRLVGLDVHPLNLIWSALSLLAIAALGAALWTVTRRWWWRALAALAVTVSVLLLLLLGLAAMFVKRPLRESTVDRSDGGRVVIQTMATGIGPDASCVRLDVRGSSGLLARHRTSACASQEFQVEAWFETATRLHVELDGQVECVFEVDWNEQRLRAVTSQTRCRNFLG